MQTEARAGKHVLVVEDNKSNRESSEMLLTAVGYRVSLAADGEAGVEKALALRPDIAIVDIGLPGLNGLEVAARIRAALGNEIFLIALSGYGSESDKARSREAGFDTHLVKPANPEVLLKLLSDGRSGA